MSSVICGSAIERNGRGDVSCDCEMLRVFLSEYILRLVFLTYDCYFCFVVAATTCAHGRRLPASMGRKGCQPATKSGGINNMR